MTFRRRKAAVRAADIAEAYAVGWATMTTLTYRLPMIWLSMFSPNASRQRETVRMISEKVAAAYQGAWAGQLALTKALWLPAMKKATFEVTGDILRASTAPARRKVKANARRLRHRKRL